MQMHKNSAPTNNTQQKETARSKVSKKCPAVDFQKDEMEGKKHSGKQKRLKTLNFFATCH